MSTLSNKIYWLESWQSKEKHNVELGFKNASMLMAIMKENTFSNIEQLPNVNFFLQLEKLIPPLYIDEEVTYGEMICHVDGKKYRVIYQYDTDCYMVIDDRDTIIKKIEGNL